MMDGGDTMLSIPADSPMEPLSPIQIVRTQLFLIPIIRKTSESLKLFLLICDVLPL